MLEFLIELEETGKGAKPSAEDVEVQLQIELSRLKQHYDEQIRTIKEEWNKTVSSCQNDLEAFKQKCEELLKKNKELESSQLKMTVPKAKLGGAFSRRNSENSRLLIAKTYSKQKRDQSSGFQSEASSKDTQSIEDENLKLKKQLEEINGRLERVQK